MTSLARFGFLFVLLTAAHLSRAADKPISKENVTFDGQTLYLVSDEKTATLRVKEYLPKGQTLDHWTRLAGVFEYPRENDPKVLMDRLLQGLKVQNPEAQSAAIQNSTTGEIIVDFVTWPPSQSFVEFNIFKYSRSPNGGIHAEQYALREYKDTTGFLKRLKELRARMIQLVAKGDFKVNQ